MCVFLLMADRRMIREGVMAAVFLGGRRKKSGLRPRGPGTKRAGPFLG